MADANLGHPLPQTFRPELTRRKVLHLLQSALHVSRLDGLYARARNINGAVMLMYHSIAEAPDKRWISPRNHMPCEIFRRHMAFLARHRNVVPIDELTLALREGRALPRKSVVITIDDGYLDTLTLAAPILAEFDLPATLYLATGYIENAQNQWVDALYSALAVRSRHQLKLPGAETVYDLTHPEQCTSAYNAACGYMFTAAHAARDALQADMDAQLKPIERPPRLTMHWDEVRQLAERYPKMTLGAHTRGHADLSALSLEAAAEEINASAADMERELGARPKHFSYPYNHTAPGLEQVLAESGFVTAALDGPEVLIGPEARCYALQRIEAPQSTRRLGLYTSGAYPELSKRLIGRA